MFFCGTFRLFSNHAKRVKDMQVNMQKTDFQTAECGLRAVNSSIGNAWLRADIQCAGDAACRSRASSEQRWLRAGDRTPARATGSVAECGSDAQSGRRYRP